MVSGTQIIAGSTVRAIACLAYTVYGNKSHIWLTGTCPQHPPSHHR